MTIQRQGHLVGLLLVVGLLAALAWALRQEADVLLATGGDRASPVARASPLPGVDAVAPLLDAERVDARPLRLPEGAVAAFSTVSGRVADAQGNGLSDASVQLIPPGFMVFFAPRHQVTTGADGAWTAEHVTGGRWRLAVDADGFLPSPRRMLQIPPASAVDGLSTTLQPDTRILGTVRDAAGNPSRSHRVHLAGPGGLHRTRDSDNAGRFRFERLQPGTYQLTSWPGGAHDVVLTRGQTVELELGLRARPVVRGRVLRHGVPVADAVVTAQLLEVEERHRLDQVLMTGELASGPGTTIRVRTNGLGEYEVRPTLGPGEYVFAAEAGGALSPPSVAPLDWDDREIVDLAFGACALAGTVVSAVDGDALSGVALVATPLDLRARWPGALEANALFRSRVRSGAAGRFRIDGLAPGRYRVEVVDPSHPAARSPPVTVQEGVEAPTVRLEVSPGCALSGQVSVASGQAPRGTVVRLTALGAGGGVRLARVDTSGGYRFTGLDPGSYEVVVCGRRGRARAHEPLVEAAIIDLPPGSTRTLDFHVEGKLDVAPTASRLEVIGIESGKRR